MVGAVDAAHCQGEGGGTIYYLVIMDANRQTVPLAWAHFPLNESNVTWVRFMEFVLEMLPGLDTALFTLLRDGAPSISNALKKYVPLAKLFYCVRHAASAANDAVKGITGIVSQYTSLANCMTHAQFANRLDTAPQKLKDYIDKSSIPPQERFLGSFVHAGGQTQVSMTDRADTGHTATVVPRTTSQYVESNMASALADGSRALDPVKMVLQVASTCTRRMLEHKSEAQKCDHYVTVQVQKMLANQVAKANDSEQTRVETLAASHTARVWSQVGRNDINHVCNLTTLSCPCGMTKLTNFPCQCLVSFAVARGIHPENLVHPVDTTASWKAQYDFDFDNCSVSTANVYERVPSLHFRMPAALPKPAGRPKKGARHKSHLEMSQGKSKAPKAAPRTPSSTARAYACRTCGQRKKGHTCGGGPSAN